MKYTIEKLNTGEAELILRYCQLTQEVEDVIRLMNFPQKKLVGSSGSRQTVVDFSQILYAESVDGKTFVYTDTEMIQVSYTLHQLEHILTGINFFRCSKSMIINIDKIKHLKSLASNRIDATLCSGEHIIISRTYASDFRRRLKGGYNHEE